MNNQNDAVEYNSNVFRAIMDHAVNKAAESLAGNLFSLLGGELGIAHGHDRANEYKRLGDDAATERLREELKDYFELIPTCYHKRFTIRVLNRRQDSAAWKITQSATADATRQISNIHA